MNRLQRALLSVWLLVSLAGAVNHTIGERAFGRRFDLMLPHLVSGYIMFVKIPRSLEVHEYVADGGERRSVAELMDAQGLLYARARVEANLTLYPALLTQICQRAFARDPRARELITDEYKLNFHPERPYRTTRLRCDAKGLAVVSSSRPE